LADKADIFPFRQTKTYGCAVIFNESAGPRYFFCLPTHHHLPNLISFSSTVLVYNLCLSFTHSPSYLQTKMTEMLPTSMFLPSSSPRFWPLNGVLYTSTCPKYRRGSLLIVYSTRRLVQRTDRAVLFWQPFGLSSIHPVENMKRSGQDASTTSTITLISKPAPFSPFSAAHESALILHAAFFLWSRLPLFAITFIAIAVEEP